MREFADILALMREPPLACDGSWNEAYRLVSVPSLGLHRTAVRVTRANDQVEVTAIVLTRGPDDYDWKVSSRKIRHLTLQDLQQFEAAVRAFDLWHRPMMPIGDPITHLVADGGSSFVEGRLNRTYHITFPALAGAGAEESDVAAREFYRLAQINPRQLE